MTAAGLLVVGAGRADAAVAGAGVVVVGLLAFVLRTIAQMRRLTARVRLLAEPLQSARTTDEMMRLIIEVFAPRSAGGRP